jgi:hypothetical protein
MSTNRVIAILVVFVGLGLFGGFAATADESMSLSTLAEKIRKGEIDIGGKADGAFGMGLDQRFHRIHGNVLGLECTTCHVNDPPRSVEFFMVKPAVDVPDASPGPIDRRVCQGCHTGGPGKPFYNPGKQ